MLKNNEFSPWITPIIHELHALLSHISNNKKIALAVSGGQDSMFLLSLCIQDSILSKHIIVFHINHQTRPECLQESQLIENHCHQHNIPFYVFNANNLILSMPNFEKEARLERYRLFNENAEKYNVQYILTAHHQEDIIETVFLKILRGSLNIFIPKTRVLSDHSDITIYRPILETPRHIIESYNNHYNIDFIHDNSNQDLKYLRNFLRLTIFPLLKEKVENFIQKVLSISNQRVQEEDFLQSYTKEKETIFKDYQCSVEDFIQLHNVIQQRLIQNIAIKHLQITLSHKKLLEITRIIKKRSLKSVELIKNSIGSIRKENNSIQIIFENTYKNLEKKIVIIHNKKIVHSNKYITIQTYQGQGIVFELTDTISLQQIQTGDRIFWNTGSKTIKSLLKDKKIPLSYRNVAYRIVKNNHTIGIVAYNYTYIIPKERASQNQTGLFITINYNNTY